MHFRLFTTYLLCRFGLHRMVRTHQRWATLGCTTTHYCGRCGTFFLVC